MKFRIGKNKIASFYYIASSLFTKALIFIITPIITRLIPPDEFGVYVVFTGYLSIASVITTLEMSGAGIYNELSKSKSKDSFIFSLLACQALFSLLSALIYLLFKDVLNSLTGMSTDITLLLILQVFLNSAEGLYLAKARYLARYRRVAFINVGSGALSAALSVFLISSLGFSGEGRIYAHILASLVFTLPIIAFITRGGGKFDKSALVYIKSTLLPLLPHYLALSAIAQSGRIIISRTLGEAEAGAYGAACALVSAISLVSVGILNALLPFINRIYSAENATRVMGTVKKCTLAVSCAVIVFLFAAGAVFNALYPSEYGGGLAALYPLAFSQIFVFISQIYSQLLYKSERAGRVSVISVSGALLCVFLSFAFVLRFGIFGVASVNLLAQGAVCALKGLALWREKISARSLALLPSALSVLFFVSFFAFGI